MRKFNLKPSNIGGMRADSASFDAPTERMASIVPLLYQSGYLTIKDYDEDIDLYTLDIPNNEIRVGLYTNFDVDKEHNIVEWKVSGTQTKNNNNE